MNMCGMLYRTARLIGDVRAVKHHRVVKRIRNRIAGHFLFRALRKIGFWR